MTEQEAAVALRGMMEDVKRKAGPALGLMRKHWPKADALYRALSEIYENAKWVQDQAENL